MPRTIRICLFLSLAIAVLQATSLAAQIRRPVGIPVHWLEREGHPARLEWYDPRTGAVCEFGGTLTDTEGPEGDRKRVFDSIDGQLAGRPGTNYNGEILIMVSPVTVAGQRGVLSESVFTADARAIAMRSMRRRELAWADPRPGDAHTSHYWNMKVLACQSPESVWPQTLAIFEKTAAPFLSASAGPAPGAPPPPAGTIPGRWPVTSVRVLDPGEIAGLSAAELRLMRNEIFARHGHIFQSADLRGYFTQQPWYSPQGGDASGRLSAIERRNVETIQAAERGARR